MSTPWFFDRLGIAPTRDAKQIKRAYALALKAIDQQAEREAFETLRAAYEAALVWNGTPGGAADISKAPVGAPLPDMPVVDTPVVDAPIPDAPVAAAPPPPSASVPPATDPATSSVLRTVTANESYGAGRIAMRQWMARLLSPRDTPLAEILDQALADPRLIHLDSRLHLEAELINVLYQQSAGRAELFLLASDRFGWSVRNGRPAGDAHQAEWVSRVVNQQLLSESIEPKRLAAQRAAITAALATDTPKRQQAFEHTPALVDFDRSFPEWSELSLPAGRVAAWQSVYDKLPEGFLRAARLRGRFPNLLRVASTVLLVIIVGTLLRSMMLPSAADRERTAAAQRAASTGQARAPASAATPQTAQERVLAFEITGAITLDSCETAHEFVHESNWLDVGDADAVALLTTRAILCQERNFWPQPVDPVMDCLRKERGAALATRRPEAPGHCRDTRKAGG